MMRILPKIAITMGDPTGIGPEIVAKAISSPEILDMCHPVILGDEKVLMDAIKILEVGSLNAETRIKNLSNLDPTKIKPGKPDKACGEAMLAYIKGAVSMVLDDEADAVVTAPINKEAINRIVLNFIGHTEFLADLTKTERFCMMLASDKLRVSLVTTHAPLKDVPKLLSRGKILEKTMLTYRAMVDLFGISSPRIGVASLNPHGGEEGIFGEEEETIILPAVEEAKRSGAYVEGPLPPDTLFCKAYEGQYDAVVAMYHDQGLIPLKLLSFRESVNVTLGLPIIRTSVDHGTAYDIAGKGVADPTSLVNAIKMAVEMVEKKTKRSQSKSLRVKNSARYS